MVYPPFGKGVSDITAAAQRQQPPTRAPKETPLLVSAVLVVLAHPMQRLLALLEKADGEGVDAHVELEEGLYSPQHGGVLHLLQ